ncbi:putative C6 transcription factor [Aspergillus candidus]|uniref:Zn(2)-C6 fungal-type domain-containing protein n=1 Tax=Aspergillus candidus TaxID=41067 RepID=A0A2I2F7N6_ASPCN|nr:hypothetical protein BDW47DRAFT_132646 [Aspergillus candidus]PLB36635.1 hypothetical protein BDW47DRAFT_132646 [Aspergillus candidus]
MTPTNTSPERKGRAVRSSLACLPCRSRHLKCDGKRPCCSRCAETARDCDYARSRRGGLNRAALAERRKRPAGVAGDSNSQSSSRIRQGEGSTSRSREADSPGGGGLLYAISTGDDAADFASPAATRVHTDAMGSDTLVDAYYAQFHRFHPFILPQKQLTRLYRDPSTQSRLRPLLAILRLIGCIMSSRRWSASWKDHVEACFAEAPPTDPMMVQCRLLYSMVLFWYGYEADAKREMDMVVRLATDLRVYLREFAVLHGGEDAVLRESWRRTWWMVYIIDAYYAGTLGTNKSDLWDIDITAELPCEEHEFESGEIPKPKSLSEFESREFALDSTSFSSFAYLIGAVRCMALAMSTAPKSAGKQDPTHILQAADSFLDGWRLLLPKNRKEIISKSGEIDELMFQAHSLINIATIAIHRPFSDLKFNPVEDVSSCAREPPADTPVSDSANIHTVRVLRSVEAQVRLLALPTRRFHHTPFVTCMISGGTLALLSACRVLLQGKDLAIARGQIRMTIGCLLAIGEVWPRAARNVREIQIIARRVLGLETGTASKSETSRSSDLPSLSDGEEQGGTAPDVDAPVNDTEIFPSLESIDSLGGWCNLSDLDLDPSWGLNNVAGF